MNRRTAQTALNAATLRADRARDRREAWARWAATALLAVTLAASVILIAAMPALVPLDHPPAPVLGARAAP